MANPDCPKEEQNAYAGNELPVWALLGWMFMHGWDYAIVGSLFDRLG